MLLTIELVPQTCFYNNLREYLSKKQWDSIRKRVYIGANHRCQICNGIGPKWPVECHEVWRYTDKNHIVCLEGFLALCPKCHKVKHLGMANKLGLLEETLEHYAIINNLSISEAEEQLDLAADEWQERSKHEWIHKIDILEHWLPSEEFIQVKLKFEKRIFTRI